MKVGVLKSLRDAFIDSVISFISIVPWYLFYIIFSVEESVELNAKKVTWFWFLWSKNLDAR